MHRLLVPPERISAEEVRVERESFHYLTRVLRLGAGDLLEVFDGSGHSWAAKILSVEEGAAVLQLGEKRVQRALPTITLAQGLAKGDKLESVVQKATELGASRFTPLQLERCVVRLDEGRAARRVQRWERIAEEAARQCGRADVPTIDGTRSLAAFLEEARTRGEAVAVLYEGQDPSIRLGPWLLGRLGQLGQLGQPGGRRGEETPANDAQGSAASGGEVPGSDAPGIELSEAGRFAFVVGPEGGFSPAEIELARREGAAILSLGERILRTETVGLAVLSIALHLAGELG